MSLAILALLAAPAAATTATAPLTSVTGTSVTGTSVTGTPVTSVSTLGGYGAEWSAPDMFMPGSPYEVTVSVTIDADSAPVPAWVLTPAGFSVNGEPLAVRGEATLTYGVDATLELKFDLAPLLGERRESFTLTHDGSTIDLALTVSVLTAAPEGLDFMTMPVEQLTDWNVVLVTNQGVMRAEFWPDVAPNHVRNYLDLAYTGFYDNVTFHRVIPGFMIQGGDPTGTGTGNGPRELQAEFNDKKHVRGVLSMARSADPNSASCQFFVMHATAPHLDNSYSAFGMLLSGFDTLDAIVNTPQGPGNKPLSPQIILRAVVVPAAK